MLLKPKVREFIVILGVLWLIKVNQSFALPLPTTNLDNGTVGTTEVYPAYQGMTVTVRLNISQMSTLDPWPEHSIESKIAKINKAKLLPGGFQVNHTKTSLEPNATRITESTSPKPKPKEDDLMLFDKSAKLKANHSSEVTEITIKINKYSKDKNGLWIYNPWDMTFGHILKDTRFGLNPRASNARLKLNSKPIKGFQLEDDREVTVCANKSTIYGTHKHKVEKWLTRHVYLKPHRGRPFYEGLRKDIYAKGNAEECHTTKFPQWKDYQECAVRRNQRLEYYVPHYPLHQKVKDMSGVQ